MTGWKRAAFRGTVFIGAILLCTYIALLAIVNSARFQQWLKSDLAQRTGYEIAAGQFWLDPLLRLTLTTATVSKASKPVLQAERIEMMISPIALFSKKIHRLSLAKPTLFLELDELLQGAKEPGLGISIRYLNIEDGALVLRLGSGNAVDFQSLAMNAQNVNLGEAIGLNLRADVPWLKGVAEVAITGDGKEKLATVRIQQPPSAAIRSLQESQQRARDALEADFKLRKKDDESLSLSAAGKFNGMMIGDEKVSGHFEWHADVGATQAATDVSAKIVATELPLRLKFLPIALPQGTTALSLDGSFSMTDKKLALRSLQLQSPLGEASATGQVDFAPQVTFSNQVTLRKVSLEPLKPLLPWPLDDLAHDGLLEADLELRGAWRSMSIAGTVQGSGIELRNDQFSLAALTFKTPLQWTNTSFRAADVQVSSKQLLARQKSDMPFSAEELRITGTWEQNADEPLKAAGQIRVTQGRFASLDGTRVGENLTLGGRFEATSNPDNNQTSVAGKLDIEQGEVLWGKFFADLKSQRPSLQFDGDYVPGRDALRLRQLNLALAAIGKVAARGDVEQTSKKPILRLEISSDDIQPAGFFEFFIRPTLNRSFPVLDQLAVGGRLGFALKANGNLDSLSIEGAMQLRGGEVQNKSRKWQVGPVRLDLPLRIQYPGAGLPAMPPKAPTGSLTIESARFGAEVIPAMKTTLSLWNNALRFRQPIRISIYGGVLEISDLAFRDLIRDPQEVSLSLETSNLQLQRLTEALGWYPFAGTLSGSIPKIEWADGSLRSQGRIQVEVFGGTVQISKLEIESPFSSLRSVKLDALLRDISLDQASETFAFGQISGTLEGTVDELVLTAGQPSQFRADFRSVEKRGVSQRISVESLNKITVLSSGSDAGALYGGIAGFFDSFRYSKLGFKATLKNDKLTLRGVESRTDGEYLVVGSLLPPTVNVVSHTQAVGFSELLRRLERIQKPEKPEKDAN